MLRIAQFDVTKCLIFVPESEFSTCLLLPSTEGGVGGSQDVALLEVAHNLPLEL